MTRRIKIMFCVLTAACLALFAAACGTSGGGSTSGNGQTSESDSAPESMAKEKLEIVSPKGEVFPYAEKVIEYLDAGEDANLTDYYYLTDNAFAPIVIEWKNLPADAKSVLVEYSTDENMTNGESVTLSKDSTKLEVYNLLKATKYYVRVTAETNSGEKEIASTEFETTDLGPRMMNIGGIYNVRDMGGYLTASGERTVQGRFFRGGALSDSTDPAYHFVALNEDGKKYTSETLGIKTDFDLRSVNENLGLTESPIPGAKLEYYSVGGYLSAFTDKSGYKRVFSALADESRYPVYMHCTGGADRTGTVAFLVNALLGVDETALIQDYELTSFSIYRIRDSKGTTYDFKKFYDKLNDYMGSTLSKKVENYMLSIGVTQTEINNIKAIMLGKPTELTITANGSFTANKDESFEISLSRAATVDSVTINGQKVKFTVNGNAVKIAKADMPADMKNGETSGNLTIGGKIYEFTFVYDGAKRVSGLDEDKTLDSANKRADGSKVIGYDGTVAEVAVKSITDDGNGGTYFFIGSYGVYYRGSCFRVSEIKNGNYAESSPRTLIGNGISSSVFNAGVRFGMSVTIKDEKTVTITLFVNGENIGSVDVSRRTDEIASENAVFGVEITTHVTEAEVDL